MFTGVPPISLSLSPTLYPLPPVEKFVVVVAVVVLAPIIELPRFNTDSSSSSLSN